MEGASMIRRYSLESDNNPVSIETSITIIAGVTQYTVATGTPVHWAAVILARPDLASSDNLSVPSDGMYPDVSSGLLVDLTGFTPAEEVLLRITYR